ncbi:MAG TPA: hypothetical protein VFE30_00220 [Anaeromyxobacteraceae bacterium]|jgi:hypothetical protein|nr:hypothetical protein [Anaeromyxobacteraceae bacterium]
MLVTATGCSAVFVRPSPHADAPDGRPACGTNAQWAFPVIDLAGSAAFAVGSYLATGIANGSNGYNGCDSNPALCRHSSPTAGYVVAGALAASAVYGLAARSSCAAQVAASPRLPVEARSMRDFGDQRSSCGLIE